MALLTCKLCGKLLTSISSGDRICPVCLARLDQLYPDVREFLRDHPKDEFNLEDVAEGLDVDIRYIQALVDKGYLDRDTDKRALDREDPSRQKLAKELENSLKQMKDSASRREAARSSVISYGRERYGEKDKKK
ncbi:MAG: hypothetical protein LBO82_02210 [Synergistaceae bacterium]|jgi:hypothetical protein|nr:hypothetical protein [Synergistaceae bacterium]